MADFSDERRSTEPSDREQRQLYNDVRDDYDDEFGRMPTDAERVRRKVRIPGIATAVFGVLGTLGMISAAIGVVVEFNRLHKLPQEFELMVFYVVLSVLGAALSAVVFAGGLNMIRRRRYELAVFAAVVMTTLSPCACYSVVFMPFGIWALVVLCNPEVRSEFH